MPRRRVSIAGCLLIVGLLIALFVVDDVGRTPRGAMLVSIIGQAATDWLFRFVLVVGIALTAYHIWREKRLHDRLDRRTHSFDLIDKARRPGDHDGRE